MAVSQRVGFADMPEEIQDQIIGSIPAKDIPKIMLSSRTLSRLARPHLYRSVHYGDGSLPKVNTFWCDPQPYSRSLDNFNPCYSTRIIQPLKFLQVLHKHPILKSYITEASFSPKEDVAAEELEAVGSCLGLLHPDALDIVAAYCHADLVLSSAVTSLDIMYPAGADMDGEEWDSLRDDIYLLFSIPTLRDLTLRNARRWDAFKPASGPQMLDRTRAQTSNVVSLSLPDTIPMDTDLEEILTWPKALRSFFHENVVGQKMFRGGRPSPQHFLEGIASQRLSLEEVTYNNGDDAGGDDCTHFDLALMGQFIKLRYLCTPLQCFVDEDGGPSSVYTILPPNLEVLCFMREGYIGNVKYEARLKEWFQDILCNKERSLPFLKSIIMLDWEDSSYYAENLPDVSEFLERM